MPNPGIYHSFTSPKADGADTSLVKPSDWNADHQVAISRLRNVGAAATASFQMTASTRSLFVFPLIPDVNVFAGDITVSTMRMLWSVSESTSATNMVAQSLLGSFGLYQVSGSASAQTLSLLNSASFSWGTANTIASTNFSNLVSGVRWMTIHSSQWSSLPVLSNAAQYIGALLFSTAGAASLTWGMIGISDVNTMNISGAVGVASVSNTTVGLPYYAGVYSATTAALPASINFNQLNRQAANANFVPLIEFDILNASH